MDEQAAARAAKRVIAENDELVRALHEGDPSALLRLFEAAGVEVTRHTTRLASSGAEDRSARRAAD